MTNKFKQVDPRSQSADPRSQCSSNATYFPRDAAQELWEKATSIPKGYKSEFFSIVSNDDPEVRRKLEQVDADLAHFDAWARGKGLDL